MYELIQLSERTYYIKSPTNIGLVRLDEQNVCLIDSGNDKDAGRKARQILDANGWNLTAIYNTHAHADHIGGNKYLQGQTGCKVYAPGIDCDFTRHPILEPSLLYGGYPPKDLRHKFLMAQESDAEELYGYIKDAAENGLVTYDAKTNTAISDYIIQKMAERRDVTTVISFEYKGEKYQITFSPEADYDALLNDEEQFYGYLGLSGYKGITVEKMDPQS